MRTKSEIDAERAELKAKRAQLERDAEAVDTSTPGGRERSENLARGVARIDAREAELHDEMRDLIAHHAADPRNTVPGFYQAPARNTTMMNTPPPPVLPEDRAGSPEHDARRDALRAIEHHAARIDARNADRLEALVRQPVATWEARYLAAIGDPDYFGAFVSAVRDPSFAHLRFTNAQRAAWERVNAVRWEARGTALAIGAGGTGGFALPFMLDPSVIDTSAGAACPLRQIARTVTLLQNSQHFVNANGVVTNYAAEAAAVSEAGPTYSQPTLTAARGSAFITASVEMIQDQPSLVAELVAMITTGKDTLEATKFLVGTGTNEPLGVLAIGTAGALTASQKVDTASVDTVAVGDVYLLHAALDPRFQAAARFVMSPATHAYLYRLTPAGSEDEPQLMPTFTGPMLGKPVHEWSTMDPAAAVSVTGDRPIIYGDWSNVVVGDRLGVTVEIIENMLNGATPSMPTGQRGLVAWFRNGLVVTNPNGLRYLEVA